MMRSHLLVQGKKETLALRPLVVYNALDTQFNSTVEWEELEVNPTRAHRMAMSATHPCLSKHTPIRILTGIERKIRRNALSSTS